MDKKRINFYTNIAPHYRKNLWKRLVHMKEFDVHFYFGNGKDFKIKQIDFSSLDFKSKSNQLHQLKNRLFKKILFWQSGVIKSCLKDSFEVGVFLGEYQIISTWIAILCCRLKKRKVVFWTHGMYGKEGYLKRKVRLLFYNLADKILTYENRAKNLLISHGIKADKFDVLYNSLDYDAHLAIRNQLSPTRLFEDCFNNKNKVLTFIGRLTPVKRLDLLIEALRLLKEEGKHYNLVLIGDGTERERLQEMSKKYHLEENCWFYGACYDEGEIAKLLYNSDLCVSPGNVGLTAIHTLSFGTPVCTHDNWVNQMPEVEAIIDGESGCFFQENDSLSLKSTITKWFEMKQDREIIRNNCYSVIDKHYNPNYQLTTFAKVFNQLTK